MKVILLHNVKKIGQKGEVKEVADGYANGFLLPKKLAKPATPDALKQLANSKNLKVQATEAEKKDQKKQFEKINKQGIVLSAPANEKGHLFAAITGKDISAKLQSDFGAMIKPEEIILKDGIKDLGEYEIPVMVGENKGTIIAQVQMK